MGRHGIFLGFFLCFVQLSGFAVPVQAEWTALLFINGKNNLDSYAIENLNQMEQFGSSHNINLIAEWGSLETKSVKRLKIQKDTDPARITSPVLQELGNSDMGDYRTLENFLLWGIENFPAKRYVVILWDHGYGWHDDTPEVPPVGPNAILDHISHDETTNHTITTPELGRVMAAVSAKLGRKIDLLATDACLMSSIEVATEVKNSVQFYSGSQDIEPVSGWPYHHILRRWFQTATMGPRDLASLIATEYVKYHQTGEVTVREVAYSVFDLSLVDPFVESFRVFSDAVLLTKGNEWANIQTAFQSIQRFAIEDYGDLGDFLKLVAKSKVGPELASAAASLHQYYHRLVPHSIVTAEFKRATGGSLWFPRTKAELDFYNKEYESLVFQRLTGWNRILSRLFSS